MRIVLRMLSAGICAATLTITAAPTPSSAWLQHHYAISGNTVPVVFVLNDDQLKGKWKQFKGELKKKWGNFTDDDLLYIEGSKDKLDGKIQERYGDRKDEVKKWIDEWFDQHNPSKPH